MKDLGLIMEVLQCITIARLIIVFLITIIVIYESRFEWKIGVYQYRIDMFWFENKNKYQVSDFDIHCDLKQYETIFIWAMHKASLNQ